VGVIALALGDHALPAATIADDVGGRDAAPTESGDRRCELGKCEARVCGATAWATEPARCRGRKAVRTTGSAHCVCCHYHSQNTIRGLKVSLVVVIRFDDT